MRAKVWKARSDSPLFSVESYARGLEALYRVMWDRYVLNLPVTHVTQFGEAREDNLKTK